MLDWLIVGGGIHGTYLSRVLVDEVGVPRDRLRVLDPWVEPLHRWKECASAVGMEFLRSSGVHHLSADPFALTKLAKESSCREFARFRGRYNRPSLDLFHASCDRLIAYSKLEELRIQGWARSLIRQPRGWRVETDEGGLEAKKILLAMGASEKRSWPAWALEMRSAGGNVQHVFEPGFSRQGHEDWNSALVIGGGISALQVATALAKEKPGSVTLLSRHTTRKEHFDSDPCWIGPKCLAGFWRVKDPRERRQRINRARHRGTAPSDVLSAFRHVQADERLQAILGEVSSASFDEGRMTFTLKRQNESQGQDESLEADRIILATGFACRRPGGPWLDEAVEAEELPCAPCGFPIIDTTLCWQPGLYVSGPLAELELGPVSRNIQGARLAGRRLLEN